MNLIKRKIFLCLWILTIPGVHIFYEELNIKKGAIYSLATDLDKSIPFVKQFIIPYKIWYLFIAIGLIILCIKNEEAYKCTLISLILSLLTAYVFFYFFKTTVDRPKLVNNDVLTKWIKYTYICDNPYNCFPSIHCITTYSVFKGLNKLKLNSYELSINYILTISILLATQFIKQHVILDLIFAVLISESFYRLIWYLNYLIKDKKKKKLDIY